MHWWLSTTLEVLRHGELSAHERWELMLNNTVSVSVSDSESKHNSVNYYGEDRPGHLACSSRLPCISCSPLAGSTLTVNRGIQGSSIFFFLVLMLPLRPSRLRRL